jgi:putative ABC transport system ATP-binding protein
MTSVLTPPPDSGDTASEVTVRARAVARHYGAGETAVHALRGIDRDVERRRLTAIMGPSGSGKSTLMHILAGLDEPSSGEVVVAGIDIGGLHDTDLTTWRRNHIGFIFQFFNLLPMLTAAENIVLPLKLAGVKPDRVWLDELVEKVGLSDRLRHRPSSRAVNSNAWPSPARSSRVRA